MTLNGKYFDRQAEAYFGRNKMITVTGGHSPTISEIKMEEVKKVIRTDEYIKLYNSIESCTRADQLSGLKESVLAYHKEKKQDSPELLAKFTEKESDLFVE